MPDPIVVEHRVVFTNSPWDTPPSWATDLIAAVAELKTLGTTNMATVEQKLAELEASNKASADALKSSLDGISGDLQSMSDTATANAAEIAALKQAIIDGGNQPPGEISQELSDRFDALKTSLDDVAKQAAEIDARLPNATPTPSPTGDQDTGPIATDESNPASNGGV